MRHTYVVTYDICDPKRLRKVYKLMLGWGDHLQLSVFQCELSHRELVQLRVELDRIIKPSEDQVLFANLGTVLSSSADLLREALPVKIFYAVAGSAPDFDTHYDQGGATGRHAESLAQVDAALAAYTTDLQQMGVWNRAVIVLFSES